MIAGKQRLALLCVCMCWVRIKQVPPSAIELLRLARGGFPSLEVTEELAEVAVAARNLLGRLYATEDVVALSQTPGAACSLLLSLWAQCCDEPPIQGQFTDWLQIFFPKLDGLELARQGAWAETHLRELYDWKATMPKQTIKRTILPRRGSRHAA